MKRLIDHYLHEWKTSSHRKSLLLRGARQVGKTYAVRELGKHYEDFVEINLEQMPNLVEVFDKNLDPVRILRDIMIQIRKEIIPGKTLLFIDEIQMAPKAVIALRYFYEEMHDLHVIAAGSLLDFAIAQVGVPVGRVQSLYMHPLSFMEFLAALGSTLIIEEILRHDLDEEISEVIHNHILSMLGEYLALGGMPEVVRCWQNIKNPLKCTDIHSSIIDTYKQDFGKYAKRHQVKYLDLIFDAIPRQLGEKFKYSAVEGEFKKRELAPALDLLDTAGLAHKVYSSSSQGFPLGAQTNPFDYKVIFLDVGLAEAVLKLNLAEWFLNPVKEFVNKGALTESFVGQELMAYSNPQRKSDLYYWHKERPSQAEVDYVLQKGEQIVPVEVKAGHGRTLMSLHKFLETHDKATYGVRFSTQNYSIYQKIHSYPLYAIVKAVTSVDDEIRRAIESLIY